MRPDAKHMAELELTHGPEDPIEQRRLEREMGFSYRQVIGEAIFAMTLCRINITNAIIKLSQYNEDPARCHYQAAKAVLIYLWATKDDGIFYWRDQPNNELPEVPPPKTVTQDPKLREYINFDNPSDLTGASGSTWASDRRHRRSTGGIIFFYAAGAVYWRARVHPTHALSSTEAEINAMADAGKAALYLHSILEELGLEQLKATEIEVDNRAARQLTNAQQPTRRTRHIDMKDFCILQWTEEEQINYRDVASALNVSDSLSKPTGRIKFHEHMDIMMGRRKPAYVKSTNTAQPSLSLRDTHPEFFSTCSNLNLFSIDDFIEDLDYPFDSFDARDDLDSTSVGG